MLAAYLTAPVRTRCAPDRCSGGSQNDSNLRTHGRVAVTEFRLRRTPATTRPSGLRRQRPLDGPWLAEDDEQVGTCGAVGLGTALLPVLQPAGVEAVPRGEGGRRPGDNALRFVAADGRHRRLAA